MVAIIYPTTSDAGLMVRYSLPIAGDGLSATLNVFPVTHQAAFLGVLAQTIS